MRIDILFIFCIEYMCVNRFMSAVQLTFSITLYYCCIIQTLVLKVKPYLENKPIESIFTLRQCIFVLHDIKSLHCLISDDAKKNNDVVIFLT